MIMEIVQDVLKVVTLIEDINALVTLVKHLSVNLFAVTDLEHSINNVIMAIDLVAQPIVFKTSDMTVPEMLARHQFADQFAEMVFSHLDKYATMETPLDVLAIV